MGLGDDADSGCLMSEMLFEDKNVVNSCGKVLVKLSGFPLYNVKNIKCKHTNKVDIRDYVILTFIFITENCIFGSLV